MKKLLLAAYLLLSSLALTAQQINPDLLTQRWDARWIEVPNQTPDGYGVYLFRKTFDLSQQPGSFMVHVSADNRYKLFVNDSLVSQGPARGDLNHWNFETLDLAPFLHAGKNVVAAQVWNEGSYRPEAQITFRTGFILQGNTEQESILNTNQSWKCVRDSSYAPLRFRVRAYYVAGAGEIRDMAKRIPNWQKPDFDDSDWLDASPISSGVPRNLNGPFGTVAGWMLVPSAIPQMEMSPQRLKKLINLRGEPIDWESPKSEMNGVMAILPQMHLTFYLDQTYLTNAYPTLIFSGGKDASITLSYAESLYSDFPQKGNRNETVGKQFIGRMDSIISDGTENQTFTPLTYRTYRYIRIEIQNSDAPLVIKGLHGTFTGYPFERKATLEVNNSEMQQILDIGWRTARLCAHETYMDCPYYEQLQYIGDTRIQALVSLYNSGDDRLVKNALNLMDQSRQPEGVTLSRHPSYTPQYIPTFSLWYIGMLYDYSRYGSDLDFVTDKLSGTRQILEYFRGFQQEDGSLKGVPQWMFTDWTDHEGWRAGEGPYGEDGTSAILDFQLLWAYQVAAELEAELGMPAYAELYQNRIEQLKATIWEKYWDEERQLFADRAEKDLFSQHSNTLAILTETVTRDQAKTLAQKLLSDESLAPASIYFKYYLHQALIEAGLGNDYLRWLDVWRENIQLGLSTWAETSDVSGSRSDCHAWGSSPNIEFFRTILGIDSDGLGFAQVRIEPHLNGFSDISGSIPHPKGTLSTYYQLKDGKWNIRITLPDGVSGKLIWEGEEVALSEGLNEFTRTD